MFTHQARFHGGAKDGHTSTIITETAEPPAVLFVATDLLPHLQFMKSRYERTPHGEYEFAGVTR